MPRTGRRVFVVRPHPACRQQARPGLTNSICKRASPSVNDPAFGGGGPLTLGSLGGGDVYAPLVPIGDSIINALASGTRPIRDGSLTDGGALYLTTTMTSAPEPGSLALLGTGMLCLAFLSLRRARQRPVQA
jgi:hypothetical protein